MNNFNFQVITLKYETTYGSRFAMVVYGSGNNGNVTQTIYISSFAAKSRLVNPWKRSSVDKRQRPREAGCSPLVRFREQRVSRIRVRRVRVLDRFSLQCKGGMISMPKLFRISNISETPTNLCSRIPSTVLPDPRRQPTCLPIRIPFPLSAPLSLFLTHPARLPRRRSQSVSGSSAS